VVINRAGIGNNDVADYCAAKGINMLAMIPNMRQIAEEYSRGDCVSYIIKNHRVELNGIMNTINENKRSVRI
jgi:MinD superfamily P-loop ATPase